MKKYKSQCNKDGNQLVCDCGNDHFEIVEHHIEDGAGLVEEHYRCSCGKKYVWAYGDIYAVTETENFTPCEL